MEMFALSVEMSNKSQSMINYPFQNKNIKSDKILLPNSVLWGGGRGGEEGERKKGKKKGKLEVLYSRGQGFHSRNYVKSCLQN